MTHQSGFGEWHQGALEGSEVLEVPWRRQRAAFCWAKALDFGPQLARSRQRLALGTRR